VKLASWNVSVTIALLAFVAISIAYAVAQDVRRAPSAAASDAPGQATPPGAAGLDALKGGAGGASKYLATYYHGNVRCPTCKKIEAYSQEAIETRFAKEIKAGKVAFRMVNYDEKGNEHFKKDYNLEAQSLIISEVKNGKELRWRNLEKVWDLTYDKEKFIAYVEAEVKAFIKAQGQTVATAAADTQTTAGEVTAAALPAADAGGTAAASGAHHVVAYYLHGDTRCPSCIKIESYADAAVHEQFAGELADGTLEWQVVNYDEPENRHYWDDFQLEVKTVVVADLVDGKQVRYKRLDHVWDLLDDQQAFAAYVAQEIRQYLEGA
jgi:hypothetical protein